MLRTIDWVRTNVFDNQVSAQRLYALVRAGVLPSVHVGRQVFIDDNALAVFIRQGGRGLPPKTDPLADRPQQVVGGRR